MDPQDITKKTGPGHELQTEQLDIEQKNEPAHRCSICEGPNHHACGCESKARQENTRLKPDSAALPTIHYAIDGRPFCNEAQRGAMQPGEKTTENENEVTCPACRDLLNPKTEPGPDQEKVMQEKTMTEQHYLRKLQRHGTGKEINVPPEVCEAIGIDAGDDVDFVVGPGNNVALRKPKTGPGPYAELAGLLKYHVSIITMAADIKKVADGFEGMVVWLFETNNYLKLIAGDMITIRKTLCEVKQETEKPEKPDQPEIKQS